MGPHATHFRGAIEGVSSTWQPRGDLKRHQDSLPCQPVPPLAQTMKGFLASVRPLLNDTKYSHAVQLTEDFVKPGGYGERLQSLLENRAEQKENWLTDWWIREAYLGLRGPIAVNINPIVISREMEKYTDEKGPIRSASLIISAWLKTKRIIDSQCVPNTTFAGIPLCMYQTYHLLGSCRVPGQKVDTVVSHHRHDPDPPTHITVMCNNNVFHVDVLDEDHTPLNVVQIQEQLENVQRMSHTRAPAVGILTSAQRDSWYRAYTELRTDPRNAAHLDSIHASLFVLSLDKAIPGYDKESHCDVVLRAHLAGSGSHLNGGNRWHDKTMQFFISRNYALVGAIEHSIADGTASMGTPSPTLVLNHPMPRGSPAQGSYSPPRRLDFKVSRGVREAIAEAGHNIERIASCMDVKAFTFTTYGSHLPKQMKLSPDGFFQLQIQFAYYKMYGKLASTYQSASLRMFRLGRTDTIRSASLPALKWCQAMVDEKVASAEKFRLLQEAAMYHKWNTMRAAQGQGIDRHLLGLKLIAIENDLKVPDFFTDPVYTRSVHWTLSTSTISGLSSDDFGVFHAPPLVPDGYSVIYFVSDSKVDVTLAAWNTCPTTDINKFRHSLEGALLDTHALCRSLPKL